MKTLLLAAAVVAIGWSLSGNAMAVDHAAEMEQCKAEILKLDPTIFKFTWGDFRENHSNRGRRGAVALLTQLGPVVREFHCTFWKDASLTPDFWID